MLLIKIAPIVPALSVSSMTAFENCKKLTILRKERLSVSVNVPHLDLSQKLMCDASPFGLHGRWEQREHLHSSRSGSHHWEDEKVPTELPESPGTKSHHELTPLISFSRHIRWEKEGVRCILSATTSYSLRKLVPATSKMMGMLVLLFNTSMLYTCNQENDQ